MSTLRYPHELETVEAQVSYDAWLRAKITKSLADPRPSIPHDQVMAKMDLLISRIKAAHLGV